MLRDRRFPFLLVALASSLVLGMACSKDSDEDIGSVGAPDAGADRPGLFVPDGSPEDVEIPDAACRMCSGDLHQVLNCQGEVITTCPPDQGCKGETCVPACDSANANESTYGCEYYSADPEDFGGYAGACFAAFVANTWTTDVTLHVDYDGESLDAAHIAYTPSGTGKSVSYVPLPDNKLPPGKVAILFLAAHPETDAFSCPAGVNVGITDKNVKLYGPGRGSAFHITADRPVVAYDMYPFAGVGTAIASATLLIPTSAWAKSYIAQSGYPHSQLVEGKPFVQMVAAEDDTTVTVLPTQDIVGGPNVASSLKGVPVEYTLRRGELLQLGQREELTGSLIESDKPIGVWGGHDVFHVDVDEAAFDSAHQQIPSLEAMGHEYVAVRYRNRRAGTEESVPWRIVGAVNGTTLAYDPARPPGAPTTIDQGEITMFKAPGPFVVKSQDADHPFYFSAHMTGGQNNGAVGDPEWVNVISPPQFLSKYVFFTDPTYPETNLVMVRAKDGKGFRDVKLDCAGLITNWQAVGTSGQYEYARIDLVKGAFEPQNGCDNGYHVIESQGPFAMTVWGWGNFQTLTHGSSYAYVAGMGVRTINKVEISIPK